VRAAIEAAPYVQPKLAVSTNISSETSTLGSTELSPDRVSRRG